MKLDFETETFADVFNLIVFVFREVQLSHSRVNYDSIPLLPFTPL